MQRHLVCTMVISKVATQKIIQIEYNTMPAKRKAAKKRAPAKRKAAPKRKAAKRKAAKRRK